MAPLNDADLFLVNQGGTSKKITYANLKSNIGANNLTVQDEGTALATAATTLNFVGNGVTATGTGATKTITIPGDYLPLTGGQMTGSIGVEEIEIIRRSGNDGTFDLSKSHFFRWSDQSTMQLSGQFPPPQNARENMSGLIKIDNNNTIIFAWDNSIKNPPTSLDDTKEYIIPFYIETGGSMVLGSPVEVS